LEDCPFECSLLGRQQMHPQRSGHKGTGQGCGNGS
jgi:hypothetical protein